MISRRHAFQALVASFVALLTGKPVAREPRLVILTTPKGVERFREIFAQGGKIRSLSVHYDLPAPPGRVSSGTSFISVPEEVELKFE